MKRALALVFLVLCCHGANAHTRSQSASDWQIDGNRIEASFSVDSRRATLLYGQAGSEGVALSDLVGAHIADTITVNQDGQACVSSPAPEPMAAAEGFERFSLGFECPQIISERGAEIIIDAFFQFSATHLHIIRVRSDGELVSERVLTGAANRVALFQQGDGTAPLVRLGGFLKAGIAHVLSGWDHLAFLAALLLMAGRLRPMIFTVTGFTIGHSLTMALVALGLLQPHALAIEMLIGFSIAYAAMEAGGFGPRARAVLWFGVAVAGLVLALGSLQLGQVWPPVVALLGVCFFVFGQGASTARPMDMWRWRGPALAALFGLAHGAGFAGALLDYDLGGTGLLWALLGFNMGVEIGQLSAIAIILLGVYGVRRFVVSDLRGLASPAAATLFGLGVFWTVSRLLTGI